MPGPTEAKTRKELIDPALLRAGWNVDDPNQVGLEIPVDGFDPTAWQALQENLQRIRASGGVTYHLETPKGVSDYVLYRPNGEIIGVVEAKRTSTDPRLAQTQAEFYVSEIAKRQSFRPFAFMTNGQSIYFLEDLTGLGNLSGLAKREVQGFFSPDDLENQLFIRENRLPFAAVPINPKITDRPYQQEAIRRVCEAFEQGKRRALIVMATGTGKTRVAMSLIDLMLRADQARRILFVADRDPLVQQALDDGFKKFLPDEPCTRIHSYQIEKSNRLYVVTLQTLSQCFQAFTPGFFDDIFFDEVHRSIFNKWNEVLLYFDARMTGLTATPAEFLDRNTFREFACDSSRPTFLYTYPQAVKDENRAPDPEQAQSLPVLVSLFNTRLALMERFLDDQSSPEAQRVVADLRAMVARIPTDSLLVKRVYPEIEAAWRDSWWFYLSASKLEFLLLKVGPLLRYAPDVDVAAATFTHQVERLKLDLTGFPKPVRSEWMWAGCPAMSSRIRAAPSWPVCA